MVNKTRYDKGNSLKGIRGLGADRGGILEHVRGLRETLRTSTGSYFNAILARACDDLLEDGSAEAAPEKFFLRPHVVEEMGGLAKESWPRYLFHRYRYDVFPVKKELDDFPPCLQIEPTSVCNYRCVFCYQTDASFSAPGSGHMGSMSLDLFKRVVDEARGKCDVVTLASRGEPLLCKDIEKMLAYMAGKFVSAKINTNAWFLDERKAHALLSAGFATVVFSADAADDELYKRLRVNGRLDRIVANVRRFQEIRRKHYPASPVITRVSGVRFTQEQSLEDMEKLWKDMVDQVAFVDYNPWENVYVQSPNGIETPCSDLWRRTFVWFDGTVNPCDVDYKSTLAVGNAGEKTIGGLWRSAKYEDLRGAHLGQARGRTHPCRACFVV